MDAGLILLMIICLIGFVKDTRAGFGVNSIFVPLFYNSIIKLSVVQDATLF